MSKFVKEIRLEKEFDGDQVVAIARPLSISDMMSMKPPKQLVDGKRENSPEEILEMVALFKKYVASIEGIKDANGVAITAEIVLDNAYFLQLIADLATDWISRSVPHIKN